MESVGQRLRRSRTELALSLDQISERTRISVRNLNAIDNDEITAFNSGFMYRSFVRQYADCVRLRDYAFFDSAQQASAVIGTPRLPGEGHTPLTLSRSLMRIGRNRRTSWLGSAGVFIIALVACCSVYGFWKQSHLELLSSAGMRGAFHIGSEAATSRETPRSGSMARSAVPTPEVKPRPVAPPSSPSGIRLEFSAVEPSWLSVDADGKPAFRGTLSPSETTICQGQETAKVRFGNAGGVNVIYNGKSIGTLGGRGQVLTVVFNRNGYEPLNASAETVFVSAVLALNRFPRF